MHMRKNNYYNFRALFCYEADPRCTAPDSMDSNDRIFFPGADDVDADSSVYVLQ